MQSDVATVMTDRPSTLALAFVLSLVPGAVLVGCSGGATDMGDGAGALETSSLLKVGTYKHSGAPDAWTIKTLVLKDDGRYSVVMYPGRAFPIEDVKTTTGKYTVSGQTLTIKFEKGNVFEKWEVTKQGAKLHFKDLVETSEFDMTYEGGSTSDPVEPVQGTDPGLPTPVAGGADIRCHSGSEDVFANLSVAKSGVGTLKLSSERGLQLLGVENVTLRKNPDSAGTTGWLSVTGNGQKSHDRDGYGKRYTFQIPTSFLTEGGKDKDISMIVGSQDPDDIVENSWGLVCTKY